MGVSLGMRISGASVGVSLGYENIWSICGRVLRCENIWSICGVWCDNIYPWSMIIVHEV